MAVDAFLPSYSRPGNAGIGRELAMLRLTHRERRLERAIEALRRRLDAHAARDEAVPRPLREALAGFSTDLVRVREALAAHQEPLGQRHPGDDLPSKG